MSINIWGQGYDVYLKSIYGWSPETWGFVSFTEGRQRTLIWDKEVSNPFIVVTYVTKGSPTADAYTRGMVTGFYLVSHTPADRRAFTAPSQTYEPEKWQQGLKANAAYAFLPEFRISIDELDPTVSRRAQSVGQSGEPLSDDKIAKLSRIPIVQTDVYGCPPIGTTAILSPDRSDGRQGVHAGPANHSGHEVPGEPLDAPKELYVLTMTGQLAALDSRAGDEQRIVKIGLSMSPETRRLALQKALPGKSLKWAPLRSTRGDGEEPYPGHEVAVAGEDAVKDVLNNTAHWLNGEFYLATDDQIAEAWRAGRAAARAKAGWEI